MYFLNCKEGQSIRNDIWNLSVSRLTIFQPLAEPFVIEYDLAIYA